MKLTRRIATVHTNQHDHIPLAYRQFTKLPSYVTSCMMLHRIQVYYGCSCNRPSLISIEWGNSFHQLSRTPGPEHSEIEHWRGTLHVCLSPQGSPPPRWGVTTQLPHHCQLFYCRACAHGLTAVPALVVFSRSPPLLSFPTFSTRS